MTRVNRQLARAGFFLALICAMVSCSKPAEEAVPAERATIAVMYVAAPNVDVLAEPKEGSEVLSNRRTGEAVSVYSEKGDWTEIQMGLGDSGWIPSGALAASKEEVETSVGQPRFRVAASPVFSPTNIKGEIVLEASINTEGKVVEITTIANTTGSAMLEEQNIRSLRNAVFYPLFQKGKATPFVYTHRVTY